MSPWLLAAVLGAGAGTQPPLPEPLKLAPPVPPASYVPFPSFPTSPLDEANNGVGLAQKLARERGAQARILWIDGTANLDRVNSAEKIAALVGQAKAAGFNTLVFDVKPIVGLTLYPTPYARKMTEWVRPWGTKTLPFDFDPLKEMCAQARAQGISLLVNFNAFSEGHREFPGMGPIWKHPEWQSVTYEVETSVQSGAKTFPVGDKPNVAPKNGESLALFTDFSLVKKLPPGTLVSALDAKGAVLAQVEASNLGLIAANLPDGGALLVGQPGAAAEFLRESGGPGRALELSTKPIFVPVSERLAQTPIMTSPNNPEVRQRILDMLADVSRRYEIDGVVFDDRLRYASLNADFSAIARAEFEAWVGKKVAFPDDVFHYELAWPSLERKTIPGPLWEAWLSFRTLTTRNFVADAVRTVKSVRSELLVGTYVGSWYPEYPDLGANWASDDAPAGYRFLTPTYKQTGWAGLVDFVIPGCYHAEATIFDAAQKGKEIGFTVEAAGQFSNRIVNDAAWVYAGLSLERFKGNPDGLKRALQAAGATTQGIMCFDLSHDIEPLWPIFTEAFAKPAVAPHAVPGLSDELRAEKAARKAAGYVPPPAILYRGVGGVGL